MTKVALGVFFSDQKKIPSKCCESWHKVSGAEVNSCDFSWLGLTFKKGDTPKTCGGFKGEQCVAYPMIEVAVFPWYIFNKGVFFPKNLNFWRGFGET